MKLVMPEVMPRHLRGVKKHLLPVRECGLCGVKFVLTRRDKETCTKRCSIELWQKRHPEAVARHKRAGVLQQKGITLVAYTAMLEKQGRGCAGCGREQNKDRRLAVDHDHVTGQ